jgi:hypothetical protein
MAISNKTRKILWGRSGNRCAICKNEIVINSTAKDDESVVAEECHIISPQANGPRHDPSFPVEKLDADGNLILLCRTHHKLVDDQELTFTVDILRQMKINHELWVAEKLSTNQKEDKPVKLRRSKQNIPDVLFRLTTGKEVLDLVTGAMAYSFDYDELKSQDEVELVGGFLQLAQDWGDLGDDLEAGGRVQTAYDLTASIQELENAGFFVFGGKEVQILEGGAQAMPSNWPVAIMRVLRRNNDSIMQVNFNDIDQEQTQPNGNSPDPESWAGD